jgi:hypothetical protein
MNKLPNHCIQENYQGKPTGEGGEMLRMKKVLFLIILFLAGFVVGGMTMAILFRPAHHVHAYRKTLNAYREILQTNFVMNQSILARKALKKGDDLKAMVYLWTVLEAGPNGSELFKDSRSEAIKKDIDNTLNEKYFFEILPEINNLKNQVHIKEEYQKSFPHGELAVVLEKLGYKEAAREHYLIASRILNISEDKARKVFQTAIKGVKAQE